MSQSLWQRRLADPISQARIGTTGLFLACGAGVGVWAANIALVQKTLGLSDAHLGLDLLAFAAGGITVMPLAGYVCARWSVRWIALVCGPGFALALLLPGLAGGVVSLGIAVFIMGATHGAVDVAMNSHGAQVERAWGAPIMSSLHAGWSLGGLSGAAIAGLLLACGISTFGCLAVVAAVLFVAYIVAGTRLHADHPALASAVAPDAAEAPAPGKGNTVAVVIIGLLTCLCFMAEGVVTDWAGVYMLKIGNATPALAVWGYGVYAAAMTVGRLIGDRVAGYFGGMGTIHLSGLLSLLGLGLVLLLGPLSAPATLLGFTLIGLGMSNVVPVLFSAVARIAAVPSAGVALAATLGYAGMLLGPPVIGFIAGDWGLRAALLIVVIAVIAITASARITKEEKAS